MSRRERLERLTDRWRQRRSTRREVAARSGLNREPADEERVARAQRLFPYRVTPPRDYVREHGVEMTAYTYDDYSYPDADLQQWIDEVGRLLRSRKAGMDR